MVSIELLRRRRRTLTRWLAALSFALLGQTASAQDVRTFIPPSAEKHMHWVTIQYKEVWERMPEPHYFPALIEHESCISLKHSRCWSPTSRLKTSREEGAGLGQLTRAYNPDGTIRFDALNDMRKIDPRGLNELRWDTVYQRPDLQIRVIILMTRQNWNRLQALVPENDARLQMADAAYNGGLGGLLNERRACARREACDPNQWFGHVEKVCLKSTKPLYAGRSACDINRHHVHDVIHTRMPKYKGKV
jgi:hypothetical protein